MTETEYLDLLASKRRELDAGRRPDPVPIGDALEIRRLLTEHGCDESFIQHAGKRGVTLAQVQAAVAALAKLPRKPSGKARGGWWRKRLQKEGANV